MSRNRFTLRRYGRHKGSAAGVFISYRRDDSRGIGELLERDLAEAFGREKVFLDCCSIPLGADYVREVLGRVRACRVLLVVIDRDWLTSRAGDDGRRIDAPDDWVRREIAEAIAAGLRIVPVLVDDATLPTEGQLPEEIRALTRRQGAIVRHRHTRADIAELIRRLVAVEPALAVAVRPKV